MLKNMLCGVIILFLIISCKEKPNEIEPDNVINEKNDWELIEEFADKNIRYIVQDDNSLYVACVKYTEKDKLLGFVYKTTDGINWNMIGEFPDEIGPMIYDKGLYILRKDSIYKYNNEKNWKGVLPTPLFMSEPHADGDMIFIDSNLYITQTLYSNTHSTYRVYPDGSSIEVRGLFNLSFGPKKFLRNSFNNKVYVRGHFFRRGLFEFDGNVYRDINTGLSERELALGNPTNSMIIKDNKLVAGFCPAIIKVLSESEVWESITDTMRYADQNYYDNCATTAITYLGDRLFAATNYYGVYEWTEERGWISYNKGLVIYFTDMDRPDKYLPVTFLECFKRRLYAGYGSPGYSPWQYGKIHLGLYVNKFNITGKMEKNEKNEKN